MSREAGHRPASALAVPPGGAVVPARQGPGSRAGQDVAARDMKWPSHRYADRAPFQGEAKSMAKHKKKTGSAKIAFDPALTDTVRQQIRTAHPAELTGRTQPPPAVPCGTSRLVLAVRALAVPLLAAGAALAVPLMLPARWPSFSGSSVPLTAPEVQLQHLYAHAFSIVRAILLAGSLLLVWVGLARLVSSWARERDDLVRAVVLAGAHGFYVLPDELAPEARVLLGRAQAAAASVQTSRVYTTGELRDPAVLALPGTVWELAVALADYSRLSQKTLASHENPAVVELTKQQRFSLGAALGRQEVRVEALESVAAQVAEADRRHEALGQALRLGSQADQVADLAARSDGGGSTVAEVADLGHTTIILTESLGHALEAARRSARALLP